MIEKVTAVQEIKELFKNWDETMIWSCLQGIMGDIYSDPQKGYASAKAVAGDFYCFAGKAERELLLYYPEGEKPEFAIFVPQTKEWETLIENTYDTAKKITRFAFKKYDNHFDIPKLRQAVDSLEKEFDIQMIDETLYNKCKSEEWSLDLVSRYSTFKMYQKLGVGVVILHGDEIVSGASSYSTYDKGIEVEVDTREDYRKRGLAYVAASYLIIECDKRGLFPSWDAHTKTSARLAEKLGYIFDYKYSAYEIKF